MAAAIIPHLPQAWIKVEALRLSRNAVKLSIRDRGDKLSNWSMKELTLAAEGWLQCHPQLYEQAWGNLAR